MALSGFKLYLTKHSAGDDGTGAATVFCACASYAARPLYFSSICAGCIAGW